MLSRGMESGPLRRQRDWLALVVKPSFVTRLSQSGATCGSLRMPPAEMPWCLDTLWHFSFWLALRGDL